MQTPWDTWAYIIEETRIFSRCFRAINATTVELTFKDAVKDVKASDFKIEGLTVSNAAVKQTDSKVVVLTTSAQDGTKEYTVKSGETTLGKFKGISAVIPTAISVTEKSQQGVLGQQVTVSASVTVAEGQSKAGIPVTFNVTSDAPALNAPQVVEAVTNADGVASYTYTRYASTTDTVVAYATGDRTKFSTGYVYFAAAKQLTVSELTAGNALANNAKKTYKVTGLANTSYFVAIKENLNVAPNKLTDVAVLDFNGQWKNPYTLTTGAYQTVEIKTDAKGEATFTLYAEDATVTPIVYSATNASKTYKSTDLQTIAPSVTYSLTNVLQLAVQAEGVQQAAKYAVYPVGQTATATGLGGRKYSVTVTDKDGKLAPKGTVAYVTFAAGNIANPGNVFVVSGGTIHASTGVIPVTVGDEGKASFRILGSGETTYAIPTVFLNTAGTVAPALDKTDVQLVGEATYFTDATVRNAVISTTNSAGNAASSFVVNSEATVTYQAVDQNGFAYPTGVRYDLSFDVASTFGNVTVKDETGATLNAVQNLGTVKTYNVKSDLNGKAVIKLVSSNQDTISVNVSGANHILPVQAATVTYTGVAGTLDRVNAATNAQDILDALRASSTYKSKLDTISGANQLTVASAILTKRPGAGYTQTQLDTTFTTEFNALADSTAPAAPTLVGSGSLADNILNATELNAPTEVRVNLNGASATEPVAGDVVKVTFNGKVYSHTLTTTNITNDNAIVAIPAADLTGLADGSYVLTATVTDFAGNLSAISTNYTITVDADVAGATLTAVNSSAGFGIAADEFLSAITIEDTTFAGNGGTDKAVLANFSTDGTDKTASFIITATDGTTLTNASNNDLVEFTVTDLAGNTTSYEAKFDASTNQWVLTLVVAP
ncbi:hypothetical protein [Peribacillus acanthi]|uniref:hypothetical protein n=1 Tax=Peribacillus acanthi TaxID=2171554 RepID=UPI0013007BA8|nr:hypothetical protein [Peribacillus acanthi]